MSRGSSLLRNKFVELDMYYGEKVVLVRRTAEPFARVADVEAAIDAMARALPIERRKNHSVLVDMRAAPLRTDPSLDPAFARYRSETERGFERAVVVVNTIVGRIRSDRLGSVNRIPINVVGSIEEAWARIRAV